MCCCIIDFADCVLQVMVAQALDIARETYLAFLMDRTCNGPVIVGSPMGGMDIEEVAAKHPDAIHKVRLHSFDIGHCYMHASHSVVIPS